VTYTLERVGARTTLVLTQDNNSSEDDAAHSAGNWKQMLDSLKSVVESTP
jgi:Activator of Hsp90 ATPase homolog 1-like protein